MSKIDIGKYDNFKDAKPAISSSAIKLSMSIIKNDLNKMGIKHDIFVSESDIVKDKILSKSIKILKDEGAIRRGVLPKPKGKQKTGNQENNYYLNQQTMAMILIELFKNQTTAGLTLQMTSLIIIIN